MTSSKLSRATRVDARSNIATLASRLARLDWKAMERSLAEVGHARTAPVLTASECRHLISLYADEERFRKRVDMSRLRFGVGEYRYFAEPLPPLVQELRTVAYRCLAPIANRWMEALRVPNRFPTTLEGLAAMCRTVGQSRPTPLILRYEEGGHNCLHQDLYGELAFPLQMTIFLSRPKVDYDGGEFLLVESPPRAQSRGEAIVAERGEILIFPVHERPVAGRHGFFRVRVRHGLSRVRRGRRFALGIIFRDAR